MKEKVERKRKDLLIGFSLMSILLPAILPFYLMGCAGIIVNYINGYTDVEKKIVDEEKPGDVITIKEITSSEVKVKLYQPIICSTKEKRIIRIYNVEKRDLTVGKWFLDLSAFFTLATLSGVSFYQWQKGEKELYFRYNNSKVIILKQTKKGWLTTSVLSGVFSIPFLANVILKLIQSKDKYYLQQEEFTERVIRETECDKIPLEEVDIEIVGIAGSVFSTTNSNGIAKFSVQKIRDILEPQKTEAKIRFFWKNKKYEVSRNFKAALRRYAMVEDIEKEKKIMEHDLQTEYKQFTENKGKKKREISTLIQKLMAIKRVRKDKNKLAFIVGIENYKFLPPSEFSELDANAVAAAMEKIVGVPDENLFIIKGENSTRAMFETYLRNKILPLLSRDKQFFFYFSGHGLPGRKASYLAMYDTDPTSPDITAFPLDKLISILSEQESQNIIIIDACFSGLSKTKKPLIPKARGIYLKPKEVEIPYGNSILLTSSSFNRMSYSEESIKHGIFTYFLVLYMYKNLFKKHLSIKEIFDYVHENVRDFTLKKWGREGIQIPQQKNVKSDVIIW